LEKKLHLRAGCDALVLTLDLMMGQFFTRKQVKTSGVCFEFVANTTLKSILDLLYLRYVNSAFMGVHNRLMMVHGGKGNAALTSDKLCLEGPNI
jgi:hypothetical protein